MSYSRADRDRYLANFLKSAGYGSLQSLADFLKNELEAAQYQLETNTDMADLYRSQGKVLVLRELLKVFTKSDGQ